MTTTLSDLKPGDKVILRSHSLLLLDRIATVDRITEAHVIVRGTIVGTQRFRISDGRHASRYRSQWITPATPDGIAEVERQQQLRRDQERAYELAEQVGEQVGTHACLNAAAAIPHLEAALAALNQNEPSDP